MTVRPGKVAEKPKVSPAIIGIAVLALVLLLGISAYFSFRPPTAEVPKGTSSSAFVSENEKWIRQKALDTKGDFSQLSPDEQARVNSYAQGRGEWYLKYFYEQQKSKKQ